MRIILVRHGESVANTQKDIIGDNPKSPLTGLGRRQAKIVGAFLKKNYNIKKIYFSPLTRTVQTAEIINKILEVPMEENADIREMEPGQMLIDKKESDILNMPNGRAIKKVIDEWESLDQIQRTKLFSKLLKIDEKWYKLTGSETYENVVKRVRKAYKFITNKHQTGDILLVTHGGYSKIFLCELFNLDINGIGSNFGKYGNCAVSSIEVKNGKKRLELMLYSKYLDDI